jgi:hypothetical protein
MDHVFKKERLLLSSDPVALDSVGCTWVVKAREEMGFPPLEKAENRIPGQKGRPPVHIATAASRGLGTDDPSKIDLHKVEIPVEEEEEEEEAS